MSYTYCFVVVVDVTILFKFTVITFFIFILEIFLVILFSVCRCVVEFVLNEDKKSKHQ